MVCTPRRSQNINAEEWSLSCQSCPKRLDPDYEFYYVRTFSDGDVLLPQNHRILRGLQEVVFKDTGLTSRHFISTRTQVCIGYFPDLTRPSPQ